MSHLSPMFACSTCVALLPPEMREVCTKGSNRACEFCGETGVTGPLTWSQLNHILDARCRWRPKPGGEAILLQHPNCSEQLVGKYVHILQETSGGTNVDEPWFVVRIVGADYRPRGVDPAYPQSALGQYEVTRKSLLDREATLKDNIRSMPTGRVLLRVHGFARVRAGD